MRHIRFLILEGEPLQRGVIASSLQQIEPKRVHEAADEEEALVLLRQYGEVDIAICNLHAANMDSLSFLRAISDARLVRAVVISGDIDASLKSAAIAMIHCLGMHYLGDLGKTFDLARMQLLVDEFHAFGNGPARPAVIAPLPVCDIRRGLDNDEFEPYYQPKVALQSGELEGAEVLARWNHPKLGTLLPSHFLQLIETHDLIDKLFTRLLEKALVLQKELSRYSSPVELAFNVHASQLASRAFAERVRKTLSRHRLNANGLVFEITETGFVSAPANSLENLIRLRLMGCGVAMDDFGTGYSSLKRLCDFPFSQLKLDGSFVRKLESRPANRAVIESAVKLADSMGMTLVVEGVETHGQREQLIAMGCSVGQGFGLARPMAGKCFLKYCLELNRNKAIYPISA